MLHHAISYHPISHHPSISCHPRLLFFNLHAKIIHELSCGSLPSQKAIIHRCADKLPSSWHTGKVFPEKKSNDMHLGNTYQNLNPDLIGDSSNKGDSCVYKKIYMIVLSLWSYASSMSLRFFAAISASFSDSSSSTSST